MPSMMRKYFLHFAAQMIIGYKPLLSGRRNTLNHAIMQISEKIYRQTHSYRVLADRVEKMDKVKQNDLIQKLRISPIWMINQHQKV